MSRGPNPTPITVTQDERSKLASWATGRPAPNGLALRSRIVLAAADGRANAAIAAELGVTVPTVGKWRHRFADRRLEGLADEPRPGPPRTITDEQVEEVVTRTLEAKPTDATHWSTRALARRAGPVADGRRPHLARLRPQAAPPRDVQAVDRPVLRREGPRRRRAVRGPAGAGHRAVRRREEPGPGPGPHPADPAAAAGAGREASHDYVRHGTTSLFAALDVATGQVIGTCHRRHRHQEFLEFLDHIDATLPRTSRGDDPPGAGQLRHAQAPAVRDWFVRHPEFVLHFTPTSSSWLNQVERFFAQITERRIRRGCVPQRGGVGGGDRELPADAQPPAAPVRLDQECRTDPQQGSESGRATCPTNNTGNELVTQDTSGSLGLRVAITGVVDRTDMALGADACPAARKTRFAR